MRKGVKGVSWYGQYGYFSEAHKKELEYFEILRNLSIRDHFENGNMFNYEKVDVNQVVENINSLGGPQIKPETSMKDVMIILDNMKREKEQNNNSLYLDDELIQIIILITEQVIYYKYDHLELDIKNPEIDKIYNNLCGKLTITTNTGGKKYKYKNKKTIREKLKKQKHKKNINIKTKKMKYKFRI